MVKSRLSDDAPPSGPRGEGSRTCPECGQALRAAQAGVLGTAFNGERRMAYLEALSLCGRRAEAAAKVGVCYATVGNHLREDPEFKALFAEAMAVFAESMECEAHRRGALGVKKAVWGSGGIGEGTVQVGEVTEYSDRLLVKMLDKHVPGMRQKIEIEAKVSGTISLAAELSKLQPESQRQLREILEREERARGQAASEET